jgi:hypothetical protein
MGTQGANLISCFGVVVAASGNAETDPILLKYRSGYASLQLTLTGTGTAKVEVFYSNDNVNYAEADGEADAATGLTAGTYFILLNLKFALFFKVRVTETGGANPITPTGLLAVA